MFNCDSKRKFFKSESENLAYKKKYKRMKRIIKSFLFQNAALCDQVAQMQERILIVKEERNFLTRKLQQFQTAADSEHSVTSQQCSVPEVLSSQNNSSSKKPAPKKRANSDTTDRSSMKMKKPISSKVSQSVKKKKLVAPIPLDNCGRPIFPIHLGDLKVHSIGEVSDRPEFHNEDYIFPIGYCSTRQYGSVNDPEKSCVYTCKVMDGGAQPRFEIVTDSLVDEPIVSWNIDEAHSRLLQLVNRCVGADVVSVRGRGADFFGLSHPTIHHLIQSSLGARKCHGYVATKFEVCRSLSDSAASDELMEATLNFAALQRSITFSKSHLETMIMIKEEPEETVLGW
ncbi:transforming growth factor beta regulator 1 [Nilaparvata lugens]|uniref:transforming growth factor beta regulator 1 n=1 Tax=Nilaparvata lugens TaxID=108931 RepID=UPI00193E8E62|nr:transforming growth factor beta regulator 1 [Nilaparvata lugens]